MAERERTMMAREAASATREEYMAAREVALARRERTVFTEIERDFVGLRFSHLRFFGLERDAPAISVLVEAVMARDMVQTTTIAALRSKLNQSASLKQPVTLLGLPAELRLHIYRFVIIRDRRVEVRMEIDRFITYEDSEPVTGVRRRSETHEPSFWTIHDGQPLLAQACKQIRHELLPLFYAECTFARYMDTTAEYTTLILKTWAKSLGDNAVNLRHIKLIKSLDLYLSAMSGSSVMEARVTLTPEGMFLVDCRVSFLGCYLQTKDRVEEYCACHLHRALRATRSQGTDGRRLIALAQTCASDLVSSETAVRCYKCGLPSVDITSSGTA
ncbi:hypothetical protein LTR42_005316 [Elasticomyces elasticus]|nr:hypothetical protein LTR42_005316 [Elasticomyces elasticus]